MPGTEVRLKNKRAKEAEKKEHGGWLGEIGSICGMLAVWTFVITFGLQNMLIPSSSMASTLLVGDHVIVDRATAAPVSSWSSFMPHREVQRGDVVVFYKPALEPDGKRLILVKRVIGVPGDRIRLWGGVVYRNGVAQNEPQAAMPTVQNYDAFRDEFPGVAPTDVRGVTAEWSLELPNHVANGELVVPPENYFVMGDSRTNSLDGRYWGFVPKENILGRPLFVYWSFPTPEGLDEGPTGESVRFALYETLHFFDETRWRRTFHRVE
jgi:signal peptidase I